MNRYGLPNRLSVKNTKYIDVGGGAGASKRRRRRLPRPGSLVAGDTIAWQARFVLFAADTPNYRYCTRH